MVEKRQFALGDTVVGTGLYQNRFSSGLKQWIRNKKSNKKCDFAFTIHNISVRNNSLNGCYRIWWVDKMCVLCIWCKRKYKNCIRFRNKVLPRIKYYLFRFLWGRVFILRQIEGPVILLLEFSNITYKTTPHFFCILAYTI